MARVKLEFPGDNPLFIADIPVRINDINYGNHVGNDAVLSIVHEARMQWLRSLGWTELDFGGSAMIMADVMIAYRSEGFYGDIFNIELFATDIGSYSFDLLYRIRTQRAGKLIDIAHAKTGMLCFDYTARKKQAIPERVIALLSGR